MKKNRILIISIVLAIALVACPIEATRNITAGIGFILGAVSVAWLGVRQRKGAQNEYEDTVRRYTDTTMMKVVWIEEAVDERWEQQEDGSEQLRRETVYLPTYEYTVNGRTYRYASRQTLSSKRELGRQVVGYYDPNRPDRITENKPRKPVLDGLLPVCRIPALVRYHVLCRYAFRFLILRTHAGSQQAHFSQKTCIRSVCCKKQDMATILFISKRAVRALSAFTNPRLNQSAPPVKRWCAFWCCGKINNKGSRQGLCAPSGCFCRC